MPDDTAIELLEKSKKKEIDVVHALNANSFFLLLFYKKIFWTK